MVNLVSPERIATLAQSLLSTTASLTSTLAFLAALVFFMALDVANFSRRLRVAVRFQPAMAEALAVLRPVHPQLLRRRGDLRRDRGRAGLAPAADPRRTERLAVGAAGFRHQLRPQRRLPDRTDPAGRDRAAHPGLAGGRDHRRRLLGAQRRRADADPAEGGRRPGPAEHDADLRRAGAVDVDPGRPGRDPGHPDDPAGAGAVHRLATATCAGCTPCSAAGGTATAAEGLRAPRWSRRRRPPEDSKRRPRPRTNASASESAIADPAPI